MAGSVVDLPTLGAGPREGLPHRVKSHVSGGRDLWSNPLLSAPTDPVRAVWDCLREVLDPEIPISVVDLGLIYGVSIDGRVATIALTYTATACPCMAFIREDVTDRLLRETWLDRVKIDEVWNPPWTSERITPEGRSRLRALGVGA